MLINVLTAPDRRNSVCCAGPVVLSGVIAPVPEPEMFHLFLFQPVGFQVKWQCAVYSEVLK